jgi:fructose/tagatose bisphosphate aldolase/FixJ family two-component response regulator
MNRRVVLIDDHVEQEGLKSRFEAYLESAVSLFGIVELKCFERPEAAMSFLAEDSLVDCIIVDFHFDNVDANITGIEIGRELAKRYPRVPLVLYSSVGKEISLGDYKSSPFFDFLPKDAGSDEVLLCLRKTFELRDSRTTTEASRRERERYHRMLIYGSLPAPVVSRSALLRMLESPDLLLDSAGKSVLIWASLPDELQDLKGIVEGHGYRTLAVTGAEQFYEAVLTWQPVFVFLCLGVLSGERAYRFVCDVASRLREVSTSTHVAVICEETLPFNEGLLPVGFTVLQKDVLHDPATVELALEFVRREGCRRASLNAGVRSAQATYFPLRGAGPDAPATRLHMARDVLDRCRHEQRILVTVNVKHPLMVPALLMAAEAAEAPICMEISPREAQQYWVRLSPHPLVQTRHAVRLLRSLIDHYRPLLQCRQSVLLHLDHATSQDLIQGGLDEGCDMVMFDGGVFHSLQENLTLTHDVRVRIGAEVMLEGEVHRKDHPHTPPSAAEVRSFIDGSGVNLLGVWAGQLHGTDYDFERYCEQVLELERLEGRDVRGGDSQDYIDAIDAILANLSSSGFALEGFRGNLLSQLRRCLVVDSQDANEALLTMAISGEVLPIMKSERSPVPVTLSNILSSAYQSWHPESLMILDEIKELALSIRQERRKGIRAVRAKQLDSLLGSGTQPSYPLQTGVLEEYAPLAACRPDFFGFVLHGGSSISREALRQVRGLGVTKANFGSSVYRLFIETIDGLFPPITQGRFNSENLESRKDLLKTFWRGEQYQSPDALRQLFRPFAGALERLYFEPCGWSRRRRDT